MSSLLFFIVSLLASVAGAICGIGGGVIIKPTLDLFGLASVSTISFLSSCTVLSMSCYSVSKAMIAGDSKVDIRTGTPLAIGAAAGGILGQSLFHTVRGLFENQNAVGAVQAGCLALITVGTLIYTLKKEQIRTKHVQGLAPCLMIGLLLGIMSSFLGIGGGPINLVVLGYFFSVDTKVSAQNSLYIILFSQIANLLTTLITGSVPPFDLLTLALMVGGGVGGGVIGRSLNRRLNNRAVDKLFVGLMAVIIGISLWNLWQYSGFEA